MSAQVLTIGRTAPEVSCQEKRGSEGLAGVTDAMFRNAASGHRLPCSLRKTDWVSPGLAVLAAGRSSRVYGAPLRSVPKCAIARVMWLDGVKLVRVLTDTSPDHIMPKKTQDAKAQMHASKGSVSESADLRAWSIWIVTGGRGEWCVCTPRSSSPHKDQ